MSFGDLNRVNTNLQSLEAQSSLDRINRELGERYKRLSTGLRINRAEDDAAGFSIASKLQARISALEQGLQNTGDAKSVLEIAEASFDSITDILSQMKVRALQAANDSYGAEERAYLQQQMDALADEIDSIVDQTVFQEQPLLDGTYQATFQVGEKTENVLSVTISQPGGDSGFDTEDLEIDDVLVQANVAAGTSAHENATRAVEAIDTAITTVTEAVNQLGINQAQLTIREELLSQSRNSNEAALSRIQDANFATEQSNILKLRILQEASVVALAQANANTKATLEFFNYESRIGFAAEEPEEAENGDDNGNGFPNGEENDNGSMADLPFPQSMFDKNDNG